MCEPITLGAIAGLATGTAGAAGALGTALTAGQALALGASIGGTVMSAGAMYQQGQVAKQTAANNAKMAEYAAMDAQRRGEEEAAAIQRKGAAIKSAQRVNLASKGLDLNYGTPADLQEQTDFFTQSDVATARENARRQAWSTRAQGQQALFQGSAAASNARLQAAGSLLAGTGQVAGKWYDYNKGS